MKNLFLKFRIIAVLAMAMGILTACPDPNEIKGEDGTLNISLKEAGPGYVDLNVESSVSYEAAYSLGTNKRTISNPSILFASGKKVTLEANETFRISAEIQEETTYYLYIAAKLNAETYSDIFEIEFTTPAFDFSNLLTVVGVDYDGYKMQVTVPKSVKTGNTAIRYNQCDLMMYNYQTKFGGKDDYFTLLYNAGAYLKENTLLEYSEEVNWEEAGVDINEDGVVDENDIAIKWNPISPGEPVVFVAGEFEWMEIPADWPKEDNYQVNGFDFPAGWDAGYYLPCLDSEKYWSHYGVTKSMNLIEADVKDDIDGFWTGAFQRKIFKVQEPEKLDAGVKIEAVDVTPVDATIIFTPDEGVEQYAFGVFDDAALNTLLDLCDGKEEYFQWAVTSYFGFYTFGTRVAAGPAEIRLEGDIFYEGKVPADSDIHVLLTAMGNSNGTAQSFQKYTFHTGVKTKEAPEIVVTALEDESTPFLARFNVKCTTANDPTRGPVKKCYYGANYKKDFILAVNGGSTYFDLAQSNAFSAEEIAQINSPEGFNMEIPTIDGETTRLAVAGFNDENTPNNLNYKDITECPAVADCTTPYRDYKDYVSSDLFKTLPGKWTITASLDDQTTYTGNILISNGINEGEHYPAVLPDSVYTIYSEEANKNREQVDSCFDRFKTAAKEYNTYRLEYQNSLLIEGWIEKDEYNRLDYMSPWDLFISRTYSGVDEKSMFSDFGPKLYLEISEGDKLSITGDMYYMPPVSYTSIPYYLAGYNPKRTAENGNIIFSDPYTETGEHVIEFPVELSNDGNTLTIKPFVDNKNEKWYPNLIGYDNTTYSYINGSLSVAEITLTRGWSNTQTSVATRSHSAKHNYVSGPAPEFSYKSLTRFSTPVEREVRNVTVTTGKMVEQRLEKLGEALKRNQTDNK